MKTNDLGRRVKIKKPITSAAIPLKTIWVPVVHHSGNSGRSPLPSVVSFIKESKISLVNCQCEEQSPATRQSLQPLIAST